jgi:hypothetical protein
MLAVLQRRCVQIAVDVDEVVTLVAGKPVARIRRVPLVGRPLPVRDDRLDAPQPPAGLLLDLPGERLLGRLARLDRRRCPRCRGGGDDQVSAVERKPDACRRGSGHQRSSGRACFACYGAVRRLRSTGTDQPQWIFFIVRLVQSIQPLMSMQRFVMSTPRGV